MTGAALIGGYATGLPVQMPMIDIQEVGTGGGSIARVEVGNALRVGPEIGGRLAGPGLLRPRRHRADHHRRQPGARPARRRPLPRRRDAARSRPRRSRRCTEKIATPLGLDPDRSGRRNPPHRHHEDGACGALGDHRARPRRRRLRAGRLWRRGAAARLRGGARTVDRHRHHSASARTFLGLWHAGRRPSPRFRQHVVHAARRRIVSGDGEDLRRDGAAGPRNGRPRPDARGRRGAALGRHALRRPGARRHRRPADRSVHVAGPRRHQEAVRCRAPDALRLFGRRREGRDRQPARRRDRRDAKAAVRAYRQRRRGAGRGGVPRQAPGVFRQHRIRRDADL